MKMATVRRALSIIFCAACLTGIGPMAAARGDTLSQARSAFTRGDYVRAANLLYPLANRGNPRAQGILGFMYENGFGVPQAYHAAADLYHKAAVHGDTFAQSRLGLIYDKGHGVPQDFVLSYMWLDLAAARATQREREYYIKLRNAVASKMSYGQVMEGQELALTWTPRR